MNINVDVEAVFLAAAPDIAERLREECTESLAIATRRAIDAAAEEYYTKGPGREAVEAAVVKALSGKPIHV